MPPLPGRLHHMFKKLFFILGNATILTILFWWPMNVPSFFYFWVSSSVFYCFHYRCFLSLWINLFLHVLFWIELIFLISFSACFLLTYRSWLIWELERWLPFLSENQNPDPSTHIKQLNKYPWILVPRNLNPLLVSTFMHTYTLYINMYIYVYVNTHIYTYIIFKKKTTHFLYVNVYPNMLKVIVKSNSLLAESLGSFKYSVISLTIRIIWLIFLCVSFYFSYIIVLPKTSLLYWIRTIRVGIPILLLILEIMLTPFPHHYKWICILYKHFLLRYVLSIPIFLGDFHIGY